MRNFRFAAEITRDKEINQYIGIIPMLPGAHTQAPTLDELYQNLQDVVQLCLQEMTEEEIKEITSLPASLKSEVIDFIDFLEQKKKKVPKKAKKSRTFGYAKDRIILKAGFDDPLDDFKDYM